MSYQSCVILKYMMIATIAQVFFQYKWGEKQLDDFLYTPTISLGTPAPRLDKSTHKQFFKRKMASSTFFFFFFCYIKLT